MSDARLRIKTEIRHCYSLVLS